MTRGNAGIPVGRALPPPRGGGGGGAPLARWACALVALALLSPPAPMLAAERADPSIVSVSLRDVPAKEAYAALAKQANLNVTYLYGGPQDKRVTFRAIHEPYWQAMARLNAATGLEVMWVRRDPEPQVCLVPRATFHGNVPVGTSCADGPFLATMSDSVSDVVRRAPPDPARAVASHVSIRVRAEPKLRPMVWHSIRVEEFVDESGRAIEQKLSTKLSFFNDGAAGTMLQLAERPWPRKVGRLRISGTVLAARKTEVAEVTHLTSHAPQGVSAAGFHIEATTRHGENGRRITLDMTRTGASGPDWLRPASRLAVLQPMVFDARGVRFPVTVHDRTWAGRSCRFDLEVRRPPSGGRAPAPTGEPYKLVMEIPTDVVEYDVRFEFDDVTLH